MAGLRYAEFSPDAHAAELIDCFYWLENAAHTPLDYPVIADASADLLLDMNGVIGYRFFTQRDPSTVV